MNISKALIWDELADIYSKSTGNQARTLRMDYIFSWAEKQKDKFFVSEDGSIHKIILANEIK